MKTENISHMICIITAGLFQLFCDLSPSIASKSLKLSFTLNFVLKDFKLPQFAVVVLQKSEAVQE